MIYPNSVSLFTEYLTHWLRPVTSPQTNPVQWDVAATPATSESRISNSPTKTGKNRNEEIIIQQIGIHSQKGAGGGTSRTSPPPKADYTKPWEENSSEGDRRTSKEVTCLDTRHRSVCSIDTGARQPILDHGDLGTRDCTLMKVLPHTCFFTRLPESTLTLSSQPPPFPVVTPNRKLRSH